MMKSLSNKRILIIMPNLGDYHFPRMYAVYECMKNNGWDYKLLVINKGSKFYSHPQTRSRDFRDLPVEYAVGQSLWQKWFNLTFLIFKYKPTHIFQLGYQNPSCIYLALINKILCSKIYFYSDSKEDDGPRVVFKEFVKKALLLSYDGALVAGKKHRNYLHKLGLDSSRIEIGYDVIDNNFFRKQAERYERKIDILPELFRSNYILVVSRLVARKRVDRALEIYSELMTSVDNVKLIIVGDGPLKDDILRCAKDLDIEKNVVIFPSIKNTTMPLFYRFAKLVLLTSEYDQWGLSINEALASGAPVLVTKRCGCADELVLSGVNGYVWDPVIDNTQPAVDFVKNCFTSSNFYGGVKKQIAPSLENWSLKTFVDSTCKLIS